MDASLIRLRYLMGDSQESLKADGYDDFLYMKSKPANKITRLLAIIRSYLICDACEYNDSREQERIEPLVEQLKELDVHLNMRVPAEEFFRKVCATLYTYAGEGVKDLPYSLPADVALSLFAPPPHDLATMRKYAVHDKGWLYNYLYVTFPLESGFPPNDFAPVMQTTGKKLAEYMAATVEKLKRNRSVEAFVANTPTVVFVDCENANPEKIYKAFAHILDSAITKMYLINDVNTTKLWEAFAEALKMRNYQIETIMVQRLKEDKSLVDNVLEIKMCEEHYKNGIKQFVICTSDSDITAVTGMLTDANFFIIAEQRIASAKLETYMIEHGIGFAYDDTYHSPAFVDNAVIAKASEIIKRLELNYQSIILAASDALNISLEEREIKRIKDKLNKAIEVIQSEDGLTYRLQ